MIDQFDNHKLYYVNIAKNIFVIISFTCIITAAITLLPTDLIICYCQFKYLNNTYLKQLLNMISDMKIFAKVQIFFCLYCVCTS